MSETLKPCPLCNGKAEHTENDYGDWAVCCSTRACLLASWAVSEAIWQALPRWSAMNRNTAKELAAEIVVEMQAAIAQLAKPEAKLGCGVKRIATERARQQHEEGWSLQHDIECHPDGEMADAALCYLSAATSMSRVDEANVWPWGVFDAKPTRLRNLEIAGALIAAEIDREVGGNIECTPDDAAEIVAEMQAALVSDANLCAVVRMRGMRPQLVTHSELRDWASRVAQLAKPEATCVCTARARIVELEDIADAIQEDHDLAESGCLALEEDLKFANARIAKFSGERDAAIADLDCAKTRVVKLELRDMEVTERAERAEAESRSFFNAHNKATDDRAAALAEVKRLKAENMDIRAEMRRGPSTMHWKPC